jgi:hypothetical protein
MERSEIRGRPSRSIRATVAGEARKADLGWRRRVRIDNPAENNKRLARASKRGATLPPIWLPTASDAGGKSAMKRPTNARRSDVAREAAHTRKVRAAGPKAASTRKRKAAGQKAASTRKRTAAGRKAAASPLMKTLNSRDWNLLRRVLADFPKLSVVNALAALRQAGI